MRSCPRCHQPFTVQHDRGVEIDLCSRCGSVFLDPGDTEARGVSIERLFEVDPNAVHDHGGSVRVCPSHGVPMRRIAIASSVGGLELERAPCCGGVFFEPGEESALAAAVRAAASKTGPTHEELVAKGFVPPPDLRPSVAPRPSITSGLAGLAQGLGVASVTKLDAPPSFDGSTRRCPRCHTTLSATHVQGVEIDVCPACSSLFLDGGELEQRGIDLRGVFGEGPEAATVKGPSTLACPAHGKPMARVHVRWIGGTLEVDRADDCCGGMFFDDGEWDIFERAARVALSDYAERVHRTTGEFAGDRAIMKEISAAGAQIEAAVVRGAVDRAIQHMAFWKTLRHLRRYDDDYYY
jgi:Zn-finger nucleic acid-binding protein